MMHRSMKSLVMIFIFVGVTVAAYFVISSRTDTYLGRWFAWKSSDIDDYQRFPFLAVDNAPPIFDFNTVDAPLSFDTVSYQYKGKSQTADLDVLLEQTGTTAFIVIKDDTILYEGYFNEYKRDSINTSFSIAKSVTALLIGIAIDQEYITSIDDPMTTYIPELLETDPRFNQITIRNLLSMKSGIAFADHDLPWGDKPKAYYHPKLRDVVIQLPISGIPGEKFEYNTYNPILLGIVLERASGQSVTEFFEENLWKRLGMEYDATWSIDSQEDNMAKMESGINTRAIDFAKIGRLLLMNGNWNGEQIVSESWIDLSMQIDSESNVEEFGENTFYQLGWWINAPTDTDSYIVAGWGHLGQYLFVFPDENMIIVRFGKEFGEVDSWQQIAQAIVDLAIQDSSQ